MDTDNELNATHSTAILDIDGTLVDTNYHHTIAWYRAFKDDGIVLPLWRIHRHIGMGGDHIVAALAGDDAENERGDRIRAAEKEHYGALIGEVQPMAGGEDFVRTLKERGYAVILASSAKAEEVDHYLDLLSVRALVDGWTTAADVDNTKPEPDLVRAAIDKASGRDAVMVGDSTFDCEAARRAGIDAVAVLTGGFSRDELRDAGAVAVYESIVNLMERLDEAPFALRAAARRR